MKNDKFRINTDYAINITVAALYTAFGLVCFCVCAYYAVMLEGGSGVLNWDNEYSSFFSLLLLPFMLAMYIIVFGAMIIMGIIPASIGLIIGSLSSIARFIYTEHGTVATKPYKILMTASYIVTAVASALYIGGILSLIPVFFANR